MDFLILIIVIIVIVAKSKKKNANRRPSTVSQVNRNTQQMRQSQQKVQQMMERQQTAAQQMMRQQMAAQQGMQPTNHQMATQQRMQPSKQQVAAQQRRQPSNQQWSSQQDLDKQRALKQRLEQKYGQPSGKREAQTASHASKQSQNTIPGQMSILDRAMEHAEKDSKDQLKTADMKYHAAGNGPEPSVVAIKHEDETVLMNKVYDLMITGYSGNLEFERDFLAEGVDMLNRMQEEPTTYVL